MMNIAIVEDNKEYSGTLLSFIRRYGTEKNLLFDVSQYYNGFDFLDEFQQKDFQIVFMDILMPGIDGMDVSKRIREVDKDVSIIFVTNMAQYAINGYDVGALDFIVKPVSYTNFAIKFEKAIGIQQAKVHERILIKTSRLLLSIDARDILYGETLGHYVYYHTRKEVLVSRQTMKEALETVGTSWFRQCSKSFFVNLSEIRKISSTSVFVPNEKGQEVEIVLSRKWKDTFISNLLGKGI